LSRARYSSHGSCAPVTIAGGKLVTMVGPQLNADIVANYHKILALIPKTVPVVFSAMLPVWAAELKKVLP
jgi:hypothetical protein